MDVDDILRHFGDIFGGGGGGGMGGAGASREQQNRGRLVLVSMVAIASMPLIAYLFVSLRDLVVVS